LDPATDVTELLLAWGRGESPAEERLFALVHDELRRIARRQLRSERDDHTLGTTALVNEAYLRLVDQNRVQWSNRAQFYCLAARAMRRVLIDYARQHRAAKRGSGVALADIDDSLIEGGLPVAEDQAEMLLAVDDALTQLSARNERLSRVVECRFFGGLTEAETAAALGITERTVRRDWVLAKGWLQEKLG
jgi:RNA polymerase sigma factor (TIGR02999 family)